MRTQRIKKLFSTLEHRILVLDGAMGTALQGYDLKPVDFGGEDKEGCNEILVLTRPDLIESIHESYLNKGADIIETNTFGGTPLVLSEYGLQDRCYEINYEAACLARRAVDRHSTEALPRFVAGSMGPTTKAISVTGGVTFQELIETFYQQAKALFEGGVDYFLIETCQDTRNIKAALLAIHQVFSEVGTKIPIAISITIEASGTMLAGQNVEALAASLYHLDLLYLGLNCATGPAFMTDHVRTLSGFTPSRVACVPNAGLPDEDGRYLENPEMIAKVLKNFVGEGWINLVGGCCGTTPEHIYALKQMVEGEKPRIPTFKPRHFLSGVEFLEVEDENRPVLVGERTNVIGSRKFKRLITEGLFEEASEIARAQVKKGAQIIDVCMANPDREELKDMEAFLEKVICKIKVPLMLDSTDDQVIATALEYCQGKSIINSINLEEGEKRFEKIAPLARIMGAALVVGTIDEDEKQGMGITRERKLAIAKRSYHLLVDKFGISPRDIYFDPLVFPVGTGDENFRTSAMETVEGLKSIKKELPETKTILGISNVSFGLPLAGREVLNSVFLYHCVQAGLDLAIVNAEMLVRYSQISEQEKELAENLLWNRGPRPLEEFNQYFKDKKTEKKVPSNKLSLEERLSRYIVEGTKEGLAADIGLALKKMPPLEIINGPLMKGMEEVGRLFGRNELIVAEVLQSAEVMKAGVGQIEPFLDKDQTAHKGVVLLATVKGDVHDIGKNLVDIIFSNNGFKVVNLGIQISSEKLLQAIPEHQPHIIGLSGLLVKSAHQMVTTVEDLKRAGVSIPVLVGGAALSEKFTDRKIAPAYQDGEVIYASDAMKGLDLANTLVDPKKFESLKKKLKKQRSSYDENEDVRKQHSQSSLKRSSSIEILKTLPQPPDLERHVISNVPMDHLWAYVNPKMLFSRHLGLRGKLVKMLDEKKISLLKKEVGGEKALEVWEEVEALKKEYSIFKPKGVYQFFKASSSGNTLSIWDKRGKDLLGEFHFPRQPSPEGLCLADFVAPLGDGPVDTVAFFAVTVTQSRLMRGEAERLKQEGSFLKSHALQALGLEGAEAFAEWLHDKIRSYWGFPDGPEMNMLKRFQAKYRGKRYSFGYPACPALEDQSLLFKLTNPQAIGIQLTENYMMDPEASVSALVLHHPECEYFSVG